MQTNDIEKLKVFCFKDSKSTTYGPPFVEENMHKCLRGLNETVEYSQPAQRPVWAKHPQDFTLFEIGEYDPRSGVMSMYESKNCVGLAQDFLHSLGKSN